MVHKSEAGDPGAMPQVGHTYGQRPSLAQHKPVPAQIQIMFQIFFFIMPFHCHVCSNEIFSVVVFHSVIFNRLQLRPSKITQMFQDFPLSLSVSSDGFPLLSSSHLGLLRILLSIKTQKITPGLQLVRSDLNVASMGQWLNFTPHLEKKYSRMSALNCSGAFAILFNYKRNYF